MTSRSNENAGGGDGGWSGDAGTGTGYRAYWLFSLDRE